MSLFAVTAPNTLWMISVTKTITVACSSQVDVHAGLLHDAILQWAIGVNLTLSEGYPANNGTRVSQNIFNLTFSGGLMGLQAHAGPKFHLLLISSSLETISNQCSLSRLDLTSDSKTFPKLEDFIIWDKHHPKQSGNKFWYYRWSSWNCFWYKAQMRIKIASPSW